MKRMLLLALLLSAAWSADPAEAAGRKARLRVVHNFATESVPPPALVDVRVGSNPDAFANPVAATVAFGDVTPYLRLKPGSYTVGVFAAGTDTALLSAEVTLARGSRTTALARQVSTTDAGFTVELLDDTERAAKRGMADVRVIHGIASPAADGVRVGAVGVGCLTPAVSFPANAIVMVPKGTYTVGVFAPSDADCSGDPLPGLSAELTLKARKRYTAIAQLAGDLASFRLQAVRDL